MAGTAFLTHARPHPGLFSLPPDNNPTGWGCETPPRARCGAELVPRLHLVPSGRWPHGVGMQDSPHFADEGAEAHMG